MANAVVKRAQQGANSVAKVSWNLTTADGTGSEIEMTDFADRSVQVNGEFGGGAVVIEGSNDGTTYETLRDPQGNVLSFSAAGMKQILETTLYVRSRIVGGAAVNVNVTMALRQGSPLSWS